MRYEIHVILPCYTYAPGRAPRVMQNQVPVSGEVGHRLGETDDLKLAKEFADWHYMLTHQQYQVWDRGDCYRVLHTGRFNRKFTRE